MDMNGYYVQQYQTVDPPQPMDTSGAMQQPPVTNMPHMGVRSNGLHGAMMIGGQTLDEMINQNNTEMLRRRQSIQAPYMSNPVDQSHGMRRASIAEFAASSTGDLSDFQFEPDVGHSGVMGNGNGIISGAHNAMGSRKRVSRGNLASLDTRYSNMGPGYDQIASAPVYHSSMDLSNSLNYNVTAPYIPSTMGMPMDYINSGISQGTSGDVTPMNIYSQTFQTPITASPIHQSFSPATREPAQDSGGGRTNSDSVIEKMPGLGIADRLPGSQTPRRRSSTAFQDPSVNGQLQKMTGLNQSVPISQPDIPQTMDPAPASYDNTEDIPVDLGMGSNIGPAPSQFPNAYSSSGFDMIRVLVQIGSRPNPEINIGAVDLSCAFVVCDLNQHDLPIVYCSDVFERLTGYTKHEVLGRNCRFLQAPDGKVQAGIKRKYVDDSSVLLLKNRINKRAEVQVSLINYRKGGQPFMNLLTMIPIKWDTEEYRYYVGFQVDLVEQPNSVTSRNPDGTYTINYQRGMLPRYVLQTPETNSMQSDIGQTIGRDEVSTVLSTIGSGESELSKRIWDKVLLENTDDVVHVLSLKGLFLYLSPACRKVLEYDAHELVGTALSSVCHPSDIVPVTRELKDTSTGASVNVVFRIRRKHSGYTWFESHGSLHTEQGKGRKCIILVGRERPVYALQRPDLVAAGGIGENELWSKMSTSGMFLYVSSNARTLLDRQPDELIGTSIQALMRADTKTDFGRILEVARTGKRAVFKHEMQNRRGQVLQAQTTIFPGDAAEGSKPTFLVAQTRLLKLSRSLASHRQNVAMSPRTDQASAGSATPSTQLSVASSARTASTHQTSRSAHFDGSILTTPGGGGLAIGNQAEALASEDNVFDELKTTRSTSWQFELRQMEKQNRLLTEELQSLLSRKKKRKRRKGTGHMEKDCANCHTRVTPEWRRGPSGNRDLCNSCGLRWAKQNGRVSPRKSSDHSDKQASVSPTHSSPADQQGANANANKANVDTSHKSQKQQQSPEETKVARFEAAQPRVFSGGVPTKVERAVEASGAHRSG